jgi:hypothetical protein
MKTKTKTKTKNHVVVTGVGRSGTSFIMTLLTKLKIDTGFSLENLQQLDPICNAGLERPCGYLSNKDCPYVVKNPAFCYELDTILSGGGIKIDHVIVPMRDLLSASNSRARVSQLGGINGGLWGTDEPVEQPTQLKMALYSLMVCLAKHTIPITLLYFPRIIYEPEYLYQKLNAIFGEIPYGLFLNEFQQTANPSLIHF